MATVAAALMELRSPIAMVEMDLHACVSQRLTAAGLPFVHEAKIAKGCRIDFLVGTIGVEIKKRQAVCGNAGCAATELRSL